jgi:hypothetical protein
VYKKFKTKKKQEKIMKTTSARSGVVILLLICSFNVVQASRLEANPIRRIVTLLQQMQKEVQAEGEKEEELYEKFMCFCRGNNDNLTKEASNAKAKIQQLQAEIESSTGEKTRVDQELQEHKQDRTEARATLKQATSLREKEHAEYEAESGDQRTNINALNRAIPALEKGLGLMQIPNSSRMFATLKKLSMISNAIDDYQKKNLSSFLSQGGSLSRGVGGDYAPSSGEIVGILKQMKEEMDKDLGGVVQQFLRTMEHNHLLHLYLNYRLVIKTMINSFFDNHR